MEAAGIAPEGTLPAHIMEAWPKAKLTTVAEFPPGIFLENIAVRSDNSMLITVVWQGELWFVPSPNAAIPVQAVKLHTFATHPTGIVETDAVISFTGLT